MNSKRCSKICFPRWKYSLRDFIISDVIRTEREICTRFAGILRRNRGMRRRMKRDEEWTVANLPDFHPRCDDRVTYCSLLFHYWILVAHIVPRDCFALISQLNIQSLRRSRLARAILLQPGESKWYLCLRVIRVATIFPSPSRSMLAPLGNGTYSEARRLADNSKWKRWTERFFRSAVSSVPFLCCFADSVSPRIPMHQFHLVRSILFHLISTQVDYRETDCTSIPLYFYL